MAPGPATRRDVVIVVASLLVVALVGGVLTLVLGRSWIPGVDACTVTVADVDVGLSTEEAERAAAAAAPVVRRRGSLDAATSAVQEELDTSAEDAGVVARALTGRSRHALTCEHGGSGDEEADVLDDAGLTARAARVRRALESAFGPEALGGFAPGGVTSGHMPGSAHYEGRALDVFFRPISPQAKQRGWAQAQWLVANAERLEIATVIFDGQIWTARRSVQGWRDYRVSTDGRSPAVLRVLEHRDHVHVDVPD